MNCAPDLAAPRLQMLFWKHCDGNPSMTDAPIELYCDYDKFMARHNGETTLLVYFDEIVRYFESDDYDGLDKIFMSRLAEKWPANFYFYGIYQS